MPDRVAVIGSNSFSGSHFVARLLEEGAHVLGIGRSSEVSGAFKPYASKDSGADWRFAQIDMNDSSTIATTLRDFQPTFIVNFASQSMVAQSWETPEDWYQTNTVALSRLISNLTSLKTLERFVQVTTPEVYGSTDGWIPETWNFNPTTPYAISRAAGDLHLKAMHEVQGFPVCFTRAANVYGPGQQLYRIVPRAMISARLGRRLTLDGGGRSIRSFIYIRDVAEATLRVMRNGAVGQCYHISTKEIVTIRELVDRIAHLVGVPLESFVEFGPERPGKDHAYTLDGDRIQVDLAWCPATSLSQGLEQTLNWIDVNLPELAQAPSTYIHRR